MTVLSVGRIDSVSTPKLITIDSKVILKVEESLRISTIENTSGLTTLTSTSSGALTIAGNLSTSTRLNTNSVTATRFIVAIWTTPTRPSNPTSGTIGYNSTITSLEFFDGSAWTAITGPLTTV